MVYGAVTCSTRQDETKFKTRSGLDSTYKTYILNQILQNIIKMYVLT